ncbi:MAG: DUF7266 family protein [Candidatus Methanogasteraceae archaeon]
MLNYRWLFDFFRVDWLRQRRSATEDAEGTERCRFPNPFRKTIKSLNDRHAVSYALEYIMISSISLLFFGVVMLSAGTMLTEAPTDIAATQQFNDIGNNIGTKLIMLYLIAPENGTLNTSLEMPDTIGGHTYTVKMSTGNTTDQRVIIDADDIDLNISYTINGIGASIPIDGETNSASGKHRLSFINR